MVSITATLIIIFIHNIADFMFQTSEMALNKSKSIPHLLSHVCVYSSFWVIAGLLFNLEPIRIVWFTLITFITHFITDFITSKWTSKLYREGKFYDGFPTFWKAISIDQMLHYLQLLLTYKLLFL